MTADLLGFVLGALDEEELVDLARTLAADPRLPSQLEAVQRALWILEFDRQRVEVPAGLAKRACLRVYALRQACWPWPSAAVAAWN